MASEARIGIRTDTKHAEQGITSVRGMFKSLAADAKGSILTGVGLGAGVTAFNLLGRAAGAAVDYIGDAIQAASNMAESQSKVNVVFGDSADAITAWSEDSAQAFGMSQQAALEAVGTYGNLFQAFGIGQQESQKMSQSLVELAADLASFNNTSIEDALLALRSGLSGETEPLKRFGIALTDARMRAVLMEKGVTGLGATLTAQQKAIAAYTIIMQDSSLAQGDFARTSDGLANQQRILAAELANVSAEVGEELLPIMVKLAHFANDELVPALDGVFEAFDNLTTLGRLDDPVRDFEDAARAAIIASRELIDTGAGYERWSEQAIASWIGATKAAENAGQSIQDDIVRPVRESQTKAYEEAFRIPGSVAKGIRDGQKAVEDGMDLLTELMTDEWTDQSRIAYYQGILSSEQLAEGLRHPDADVRDAAIEVKNHALRELERLTSGAYDAGATGTGLSGYAGGIRSGKKPTEDAAGALQAGARAKLMFNGNGIGAGVALSYAAGLSATTSITAVRNAAYALSLPVMKVLAMAGSPDYTHSREIGERVGETWGEGLRSALVNFTMPRLDAALPGGTGGGGSGWAGGGGQPSEIHVHTYLDGKEVAENVTRWQYLMAPAGASRLPR